MSLASNTVFFVAGDGEGGGRGNGGEVGGGGVNVKFIGVACPPHIAIRSCCKVINASLGY